VADKYCGNCGHELPEDVRFCPNCGRPLGEASQGPTQPAADPGAGRRPGVRSSWPPAGQRRMWLFIMLVSGSFSACCALWLIFVFYATSTPISFYLVLLCAFMFGLGSYNLYKGWQLLE
jgi:uncharacterized membrane protein YvbJ